MRESKMLLQKRYIIFFASVICVLFGGAKSTNNYQTNPPYLEPNQLDLYYHNPKNVIPIKVHIQLENSHSRNIKSIYGPQEHINFAYMTTNDFSLIFQNITDEDAIFKSYELYAFPNFVAYARSLNGYEKFIISLYEQIRNDKHFRKQTTQIAGFKSSFCLWSKTKSGFHEFINKEAQRIIQEQYTRTLCLKFDNKQTLQKFVERWEKKIATFDANDDCERAQRYKKRVIALNQTIRNPKKFDYSDSSKSIEPFANPYENIFAQQYGTFLDKQLHKELFETRMKMLELQKTCPSNNYLQSCARLINCMTAQAKQEQNVEKAFSLSDFCYDVVCIITRGTVALTKGVIQGVGTMLNPAHWKEMVHGTLNFIFFLADETDRLERFDNRTLSSLFIQDSDLFFKASQDIEAHCKARAQAIQPSLQKLKQMSLEELLTNGSALTTTIILDGVICHVATLCASKAGRALVSQIADVLNSSAAQERMIEIAGIGKLALEEGAEAAVAVVEHIAGNPEIVGQGSRAIAQEARRIAGKAIRDRGAAFEEFLLKKLGGRGSFKVKNREFDGAVGNIWYEAKSGQFWDMLKSNQSELSYFQERMGTGLRIARENGASYELYSNALIPQDIKNWLTKKGISFKEFLGEN